jgi:TonB-dependent SusC/RagA subfamily outer membrane receptor
MHLIKQKAFSNYVNRFIHLSLLSIVVLLFSFRTKEEKMTKAVSIKDTTKKVMIVQGYKISPEDTLIASKGNNNSIVIKMDGAGAGSNGQKPLYVLDGEVISESIMKVIDQNKIEAINVFKGPSASSLYGDKGKDGVIMITTKKGNAGKDDRGPIVVQGYRIDKQAAGKDGKIEIVADTVVIANGKTVFIKSPNLKDGEFMAKNFDGAGNVIEKVKVEIQEKSGSKTSPSLIFVDGEKKTKKEMDALSPDQIKSVEIIKGESAIKAYGPDAKDGVIKITTKKKVDL